MLKGSHLTVKQKAQQSVAHRGHVESPEQRAKIGLAQVGHKMSGKTREAIRVSRLGSHQNPEARRKIGEANKINQAIPEIRAKNVAWHTGRIFSVETRAKITESNKRSGCGLHPMSDETRAALLRANLGRPISPEQKAMISARSLGHITSEETKHKMSIAQLGPLHHNWQGGITSENHRARRSREYDLWRTGVFVRDDFTCQKCGEVGGRLEAHHMDCFADFPEKRLEPENGITFCEDCHDELNRRYGQFHNRRWQVDEFLEGGT